jgi:3-methyl-2-oxobutanoate hydroxymethyltransferase
MPKKTILDFHKMKEAGEQITWMTAYDFPQASFQEAAGIDMILVGDSLGMIVLGYNGTIPVTMDDCIRHCQAVRRGALNTFVIGDMPFGSYQISPQDAVRNAVRFLKEADMDAVKLEGGKRVAPQIRALVDSGIVTIGHLGLTPQSSGQLGGFKAQGRTADSAMMLVEDSVAVYEAGAHLLLLEAIPDEVGELVTKLLPIPVLGIGAGSHCDGQLLISGDALGLFQAFTPKFVKKYAALAQTCIDAYKTYVEDVHTRKFPTKEHFYGMPAAEAEEFRRRMTNFKLNK